jgi:RNA exonuclease 1
MLTVHLLSGLTPKATGDSTSAPSEPPPPTSPRSLKLIISNLNTQLTELHRSLPPRTAMIIFTGHSDPRRMTALNARKSAFEAALRSGKTTEDIGKDMWWTSTDARGLEEEVEKAKRGLLFLGIK